jgi:DNA-binding LacI/PurR family transcriptional regulator
MEFRVNFGNVVIFSDIIKLNMKRVVPMDKNDNRKPTIKTIAKIAGVAHSSVSRAINDDPTVSKVTAKKIKKIAKEIGYVPNAFARALVTKKKPMSVGMIVPSLDRETVYNIDVEYINVEATKRGISVLLGICNREVKLEKHFCNVMCENRVGVLLISPLSSDVSHIKEICEGKVPVIYIGGKTGIEEEYYITMDYANGLSVAVGYLHDLGHRDIAFAVYSPENKTVKQKIIGYRAAMHTYGLNPAVYWEGDSADTFKAGRLLIKRMLDKNTVPTAICCASDLMAIGVIDALRSNGLRVPEDVSVIGHDDIFLSGIESFSITTLAISEIELAKNVLDLSVAIINNKVKVNGYTMTPSLVERKTVAKVKTAEGGL